MGQAFSGIYGGITAISVSTTKQERKIWCLKGERKIEERIKNANKYLSSLCLRLK